jgi:hypothetical protein
MDQSGGLKGTPISRQAVAAHMVGRGAIAVVRGEVSAIIVSEGSSYGDRVDSDGNILYVVPSSRATAIRAFKKSRRTGTPVRVFARTRAGSWLDLGLYTVRRVSIATNGFLTVCMAPSRKSRPHGRRKS